MSELYNDVIQILTPIKKIGSPNSKYHNTNTTYIHALITRAQILHSTTRKEIADNCGISLSTLNRYISFTPDTRICPYPAQYTFEKLAGINSKGDLYRIFLEHVNADLFNIFDGYDTNFGDSIIGHNVHFTIALDISEVTSLKEVFKKHNCKIIKI